MAATPGLLSRREIRVKVMQALYAQLVTEAPATQVFEQHLADTFMRLRQHALDQQEDLTGFTDARFMESLYYGTLQGQEDYLNMVSSFLQNWDIDRVALIDRIALMMGIHELLDFSEVPVRVTLNEYLDIARTFSTDKSSQFVNGVLDTVLKQLQQQGRIQKAGRGLIEGTPAD